MPKNYYILGRNKAIVAIARKFLVTVWYVLAEECVDRHAQPEIVARKYMQFVYNLGKENRPPAFSAAAFVRLQLDQLALGADLTSIPWETKEETDSTSPSGLRTT